MKGGMRPQRKLGYVAAAKHSSRSHRQLLVLKEKLSPHCCTPTKTRRTQIKHVQA